MQIRYKMWSFHTLITILIWLYGIFTYFHECSDDGVFFWRCVHGVFAFPCPGDGRSDHVVVASSSAAADDRARQVAPASQRAAEHHDAEPDAASRVDERRRPQVTSQSRAVTSVVVGNVMKCRQSVVFSLSNHEQWVLDNFKARGRYSRTRRFANFRKSRVTIIACMLTIC